MIIQSSWKNWLDTFYLFIYLFLYQNTTWTDPFSFLFYLFVYFLAYLSFLYKSKCKPIELFSLFFLRQDSYGHSRAQDGNQRWSGLCHCGLWTLNLAASAISSVNNIIFYVISKKKNIFIYPYIYCTPNKYFRGATVHASLSNVQYSVLGSMHLLNTTDF